MISGLRKPTRDEVIQGIWFEGALLTRILMQTIWITVWYQSLMEQRVTWLTAGAVIFLALFVSTLLVRLFDLRTAWRRGLRTTIFGAWMLAFFLLSINWLIYPGLRLDLFETIQAIIASFSVEPFDYGPFWHLLLILVLIWQGVKLGKLRGSLPDTVRGFKVGILMLILHGLIYMPPINLLNSLPLLVYLVLGLLATSINRMADLIPSRGGRLPTSTGKWWAAIAAAAVLLTAIILLAGGTLHGVVRIGVFVALALVLLPSILVLIVISVGVMGLVTMLTPQVEFSATEVLDSFGNPVVPVLFREQLMKNLDKAGRQTIGDYFVIAAAVLILLVIIVVIIMDLRSKRSIIWRAISEEGVSSVFDRFRLRVRRERNTIGRNRGWGARRLLAAARIRRIYASLLDLCDRVGAPRHPAQTPLEFLPVLSQTFPDHASGAGLITRAYLKIRYGGFPESREEVEQVEAAWKSIQAHGRLMVLAKKREERERQRD